jgi:hypothetical protein
LATVFLYFISCPFSTVGHDGLLQVFQVDIDPPQMVARREEMVALDKNEDFR